MSVPIVRALLVASFLGWGSHGPVAADETSRPSLVDNNRASDEQQEIKGRLVLPVGLDVNLGGTEITVGTFYKRYAQHTWVKCDKDGEFAFKAGAGDVFVFACTADGKAAGSLVSKTIRSPIELRLRPTIDFHGRMLTETNQPLIDHRVVASCVVETGELFGSTLEVKQMEMRTDDQGHYTIRGVPSEMRVRIMAQDLDSPIQSSLIEEVFLEQGESRPRLVTRLKNQASSSAAKPLAERYKATLRDCGLAGYHAMVITYHEDEPVSEFVKKHLSDYQTNRDNSAFMQIMVPVNAGRLPTMRRFCSSTIGLSLNRMRSSPARSMPRAISWTA